MSKWLNKLVFVGGATLLPAFAFTQSQESFPDFVDRIILLIFKPITLLIGGLAVIYFLVGVLKYIQSADNEEKRKEGTMMMTYGIIALFVMVSLWGLVGVLDRTFGLTDTVISFPTTRNP